MRDVTRLHRFSKRLLLRVMLPRRRSVGLTRLGSAYGGWWVPLDLLDHTSVCYLAGVGEDATFDLELIDRVGCEVWAMDPTPRAVAYAGGIAEPKFHMLAVGLWSNDSTQRFFAPRDSDHVSHSVVNLQTTSEFFEARCRSLPSLMDDLGHERVDLLKLDIEGAEIVVLRSMLDAQLHPRILCVEFDSTERLRLLRRDLSALKRAGYVAHALEGLNVTLIRAA